MVKGMKVICNKAFYMIEFNPNRKAFRNKVL
jgi:hypothetical protein